MKTSKAQAIKYCSLDMEGLNVINRNQLWCDFRKHASLNVRRGSDASCRNMTEANHVDNLYI